jgi:peptidoglycan/LPS O-acetylase OafA/YrhL
MFVRRGGAAATVAPGSSGAAGGGRIDALDGIRAIAVTAVVVYHLFPDALPGGFLGVDVFFVLSGYLITRGLAQRIASGKGLGLARFWWRRTLRLLPALGVMLVVVAAVTGIVGGPAAVRLRPQLVAALTYTSNWYQAGAGLSYFERTEPPVLQHLWSLAVEEQFYLVWPPLLIAIVLLARSARAAAGVTAVLAAASAVAMAVTFVPGEDPSRLYFGTDTHGFSLLIGGVAALVSLIPGVWAARWLTAPSDGREKAHRLVVVSALAVCVLGMVLIGETSTFAYRGGIVLVDLAAAIAVVSVALPGQAAPFLGSRPLVWVGRRSYAIYLWHWPLIVLLATGATIPEGTRAVLVVGLSLGLAALSWTYVERPVQRLGLLGCAKRFAQHLRSGGFVPVAGTVVVAITVWAAAGGIVRSPATTSAESYVAAGQDAIGAAAEVQVAPDGPADPRRPLGKQTTVIGDSVTLASAKGLLAVLPGIDIRAEIGAQMWDAPDVVGLLQASGELRPVVVIALGTNGDFNSGTIDEVVEAAGPGHLFVFVTAHADRDWIPSVNAKLRGLAKGRRSIAVADWDAAASEVTDFASDGIHPGPQGGRAFAGVVEDAIASLARP